MENETLDILFVNGVNFNKETSKEVVCLGQLSLYQVVKPYYKADIYNFRNMTYAGEISFDGGVEDRLEIVTAAILERKPKIVSFYAMSDSFLGCVFAARALKKKAPDIFVVFGGPQSTIVAQEAMESYPFIDFIAKGEGERTILPLMDALVYGTSFKAIPGLCYRSNGEYVSNPEPAKIPEKELKNCLVRDYHRLNVSNVDYLLVEGGRGCPFQCSFCTTCTFWGREFRLIEPQELIQHFYYLKKKYGVTSFSVQHDLFTADRKRLEEFCDLIKDTEFEWYCSSRVDTLDAEMIRKLKESHCTKLYFGIETGSPRMQKLIHKNLNLEKAHDNIRAAAEAGIQVVVSLIYGFPEETLEDFQQTVAFYDRALTEGAQVVQMHVLMFTSGTEETKKAEQKWHYDPDAIDPSSVNYIAESEEGKREIREHPGIYSHYYTIDTDVLNLYGKIHIFSFGLYPASMQYIAETVGLFDFYGKHREIIERHAGEKARLGREGASYKGLLNMYLELADASDDMVLAALLRMETAEYQKQMEAAEKKADEKQDTDGGQEFL